MKTGYGTFVRNQLYMGDFGVDTQGSEQNGIRPFVVIQNNTGNQYSSNIIVAPITSVLKPEDKTTRKLKHTHVVLSKKDYPSLSTDSVILTEQIRTISKERVKSAVSTYNVALYKKDIKKLNEALAVSIGLKDMNNCRESDISRGDVLFADLGKGVGYESNGIQPVLVIQNDVGNYHSTTTIVVPISLNKFKKKLPTHVELKVNSENATLLKGGIIQTEQIRTIDKSRVIANVGKVSKNLLEEVDKALHISVELKNGQLLKLS